MFILRSLRYWLTLVVLFVVMIAFLVVWLYVTPTLQSKLVDQKLETLRRNLSLVQSAVAVDANGDLDSDAVRELLRYQCVVVDGRINARVVILDAAAKHVLADSRPGLRLSLRDYPIASRTTLSGTTELQVVTVDGIDYAAVASVTSLSPRPEGGPPRESAVVLVIASLDDVQASVSLLRERLTLATGLALAAAAVVGFIVAWAIARRLRTIEREAQVIADGDLTASVRVHAHDEIGQLAEGFNRMGERLAEAFRKMHRHEKRIEVLLNTLDEGIIGVDAHGSVTIANQAAAHLLGPRVQEGLIIEGELPDAVLSLWRSCIADGQTHSGVFDHRKRTIEAMVFPVYPVDMETNTHCAITLRDISAQARLDRARKDFLANASHELKTPLFSLAGFLDILADDCVDDRQRRRFLEIMQSQVARMRHLAVDLLDLSRLDAGGVEANPTLNVPAEVVAGTLGEFEATASARSIRLALDATHAPPSAFLDTDKLGQIVRILIDNAIKYSPDRGVVYTYLEQAEGTLVVRVVDNGPAIPDDELETVFERFYTRDRTRNGKAGAGLGLSIARELAHLMGGHIEAEPTNDHGAVFVLRLPLLVQQQR